MAFRAANKIWVFAAHPTYKNCVKAWLEEPESGTAGRKRVMAQRAIALSYDEEDSEAKPSKVGTRYLVKRISN